MAASFATLWRTIQAKTNVDRFICEIIGDSKVLGVRLPSDPQTSQSQQARRLLLRLKWVFDSHRVLLLHSSSTSTPPIERKLLLRTILHIISIADSAQSSQEKNLDYLLFRRIVLETLLSAVGVYLISQSPLSFDEDDLLQSQFQQLVEGWRQAQDLSELELILHGIILAALTAHQEGDFEGSQFIPLRSEENSTIFTELSMTSSDAFLAEHIRKSTMELVSSMRVLDYAKPFFTMYNTVSEIHGMFLIALDQKDKRKALTENSLVMLRSISEARQTGTPSDDFYSMSTFLLEMFMSGLSVMHSSPKEEREFGNPLTERMKRISKAEAVEFYQFCCRGQNRDPSTQPDPPLSSRIFLQSDQIQQYDYEGPYSRPTSSISSTPTYTSDGPQTPFRSRSPMNMDEIVSYKIGREGSPEPPPMASIVSRNSDRVKRKAIPSPKPAPRSIDGSSWTGVDMPGPGRAPNTRLGSMDTNYSLPPTMLSEANSHNAKEDSWHETPVLTSREIESGPPPAQMFHQTKPSTYPISSLSYAEREPEPAIRPVEPPPPVPARADSRAPMHHLSPISPSETDAGNITGPGRELPIFRRSERAPFLARATTDTTAMSYSESEPSHSEADTGNTQGSVLEPPVLRHLQPSPISVQDSDKTEVSRYPTATVSYLETRTGNEKHRGEEAPVIERLDSPLPQLNLLTNAENSASSRTFSNADDCTLELVTDLRRSPPRSSGAKYPQTAIEEPPPPGQFSPSHSVALKDIEAGLELATAHATPPANSTNYYSHPERIEPDAISVRPSIRSSGSNKKSKLGFFKRLGGSKSSSSPDASPPLPSSLQACFSISGQSLFLWSKRDSDFIVRINHPFTNGHRVDLGMPREPKSDACSSRKGFSIRLVAASSHFVAAYTCMNGENRVHAICADREQHSVLLGEGIPLAMSLAISPEKGFIALGCGSSIIIYRIKDGQLQKEYQVGTQIDSSAGSIRFQRLSFSADSKKLIAATQVSSHSADRHTVYIKIWERFGSEFRNGPVVEDVPLTVGYGGDLGLTSVFHSEKEISQIFLAASSSKPFPAILYPDKTFRSRHLNLVDKRITSAAQCLLSSSSHLFAIQSGHHKLFTVDIQTAITRPIADFSSERRNIPPGQEAMAIGIENENTVYAFWRTADDKLVLRKINAQGRDCTTELVDLTGLYVQTRAQ